MAKGRLRVLALQSTLDLTEEDWRALTGRICTIAYTTLSSRTPHRRPEAAQRHVFFGSTLRKP